MAITHAFLARFGEIISSRICHDLIGPINSIANVLELMDEDGQGELVQELQSTMKSSSHVVSARLRYFRLCFGQGGHANWQREELRTLVQNYLDYEGIRIEWSNLPLGTKLDPWGKIILHMVFHCASALRRNGVIKVTFENKQLNDKTTTLFHLSGSSERPLPQNLNLSILCDGVIPDVEALSTSNVTSVATRLLIEKQELSVQFHKPLTFTLGTT